MVKISLHWWLGGTVKWSALILGWLISSSDGMIHTSSSKIVRFLATTPGYAPATRVQVEDLE
jgi:hypothetical protein